MTLRTWEATAEVHKQKGSEGMDVATYFEPQKRRTPRTLAKARGDGEFRTDAQ